MQQCLLIVETAEQIEETSQQQAAAEEATRKASVDDMTAKLSGITEGLNRQQEVMNQQSEENTRLKAQLAKVGNVVELSEKMKVEYDKELQNVRAQLVKQVCHLPITFAVQGVRQQCRICVKIDAMLTSTINLICIWRARIVASACKSLKPFTTSWGCICSWRQARLQQRQPWRSGSALMQWSSSCWSSETVCRSCSTPSRPCRASSPRPPGRTRHAACKLLCCACGEARVRRAYHIT